MRASLATATLFLSVFCLSFSEAKAEDGLKVVELFTSQGCASCPPADKLLSELATRDDIIALGCHVDYWDHLQWKDTYSQAFCTNRQRVYNAVLDTGIYTPQIVINGTDAMVGTRPATVQDAIDTATILPALPVTREGGEIVIDASTLADRDHLAISIFGYGSVEDQKIDSGENKGKNITYANPVTMLGNTETFGGTETIRYAVPEGAAGYAVTVHDAETGAMIAAGKLTP